MRETVSACLIVRDEAKRLPEALASVTFCDQIVVVDSGSSDGTVDLAHAAGAHVVQNPWPGFAAQRNVALDHATGDWVLEVDADERVTPSLRAAIQTFLEGPSHEHVLAALALRHVVFGRAVGPAGKFPDYKPRLFRRGVFRHDERRSVHEGLVVPNPIVPLAGELLHLRADTFREAVGDCWRYAQLEAQQSDVCVKPSAVIRGALLRPSLKFAWRLTVDGGWRDGWRGVALIALDCAFDGLVWLRLAVRPRGGNASPGHFARSPQVGPVRIVGLAAGSLEARLAVAWLQSAGAAGADVALIADEEVGGVPVRSIPHVRLLPAIRALDAERRLRPVDALLLVGRRATRLARLVPSAFRGTASAALIDEDPAEAVQRITGEARSASDLDRSPPAARHRLA